MQNILQRNSKKARIVRMMPLFIFFAAIAAAVCLFNELLPKSKDVPDFVPTYYSSLPGVFLQSAEENEEKTPEMNNFMQNNAKNEIFEPVSKKNTIKCENVTILMKDKSVMQLPLEEYVLCCVLGEMPVSFESQALMAQCVAVRTFTVRQKVCGKSKHKNADVCTSPACCQSFANPKEINVNEEKMKKLEDAVNATRGMIMTFEGIPIEAVYHASSGEKTLASEEVWGGRVEYLRSVKSPDGESRSFPEGMGHRVGMSQHGANLLAKEGLGYASILKYYYKGIEFDFLV